jgi:hypothetical protein
MKNTAAALAALLTGLRRQVTVGVLEKVVEAGIAKKILGQ